MVYGALMVTWRRGMTRLLTLAAATAVFFAAQMLGPAQASTVTYNLALSAIIGGEDGTGSLTVDGPIASSGFETFTSASTGGLDSLSFLISGNSFTLGNAAGTSSATFLNGSLISLAYAGALAGATLSLTLNSAGLVYSYLDLGDPTLTTVGAISASATPLPATWTMMLIGLVGLGLVLSRRKVRGTFVSPAPA
jgi:hypothetical protein